jgi:hypothetical protein
MSSSLSPYRQRRLFSVTIHHIAITSLHCGPETARNKTRQAQNMAQPAKNEQDSITKRQYMAANNR